MPIQVFDSKRDSRNILVTPQIRSRFFRYEPGQVGDLHSHDLGHEIFLILQGRAHFKIAGEEAELGPGQLCVALVDEPHQVRNPGSEPMIMYLSVTPHIQPTHTGRNEDGSRHPTRFRPSPAYDVETDTQTPVDTLIDRFVAAAQSAAKAAREAAQRQEVISTQLKLALAAGDEGGAGRAREEMWQGVSQTFKQVYALGDVWNALAPRAGKAE